MVFERLTEDILIDVVKYACLDGKISSRSSLASVNLTLNRIITPKLYRDFTEANHISVPKLLRTVLRNPQLASYVRRYTGHGIRNVSPQEPFQKSYEKIEKDNPMAQMFQQIMVLNHRSPDGESLNVLGLEEADFAACRETMKVMDTKAERIENWMLRIRKGEWHALTSLLLLLLPNLEEIEMIGYRHDEAGDMEYALGIAARLQRSGVTSRLSLEHLTDVSLSAFTLLDDDKFDGLKLMPDREYLYFADIMPFLRLQSVQSVAVSRLSSEQGQHRREAALPTKDLKFSTNDLEINDSALDMWWLITFLRRFTSLRRFSYNHVAMEQEPDFLPQQIGKAIAHLCPFLEELEISDMCELNGKYTTPERIGSLAGFERLMSVDVSGPTLYGYPNHDDGSMPVFRLYDNLPRALEKLVLSPNDSPHHEEHLRELLEVKEVRFPHLNKVVIKWLGRSLKDPKKLKREFKSKGVTLII